MPTIARRASARKERNVATADGMVAAPRDIRSRGRRSISSAGSRRMTLTTAPQAPAKLITRHQVRYWRVIDCPYCGSGFHDHDAGTAFDDPDDFLVTAWAPCSAADASLVYRLVQADE
jgi:hypothetical protein